MTVQAASSTSSGASVDFQSTAAMRDIPEKLDKDAFLRLLITQLRNQDPLSPMEDKDFIAQLAQFSSLEQMYNLTSGFGTLIEYQACVKAFAMIGKQVEFRDLQGGQSTGKVSGVVFEDGRPVLEVGSSKIELGDVIRVYE
ncbi:MAG: flagellar hook capping FlgD N-terminal domain-containing protein [Armatimonadota bacterium]